MGDGNRGRRSRVWFNKAFSSIHGVLRQLRGGWKEVDGDLVILGSHSQSRFGPFVECDIVETEPALLGREYVEWCLDFCRRHGVDVFVPGKQRETIADYASEFSSAGVRLVIAGDGETLRLLEDKGRFLEALPPGVRAHRFERVRTWDECESAMGRLEGDGCRVCVKPAQGTFGLGFHVVNDHLTPLRRLMSSESYGISRQELTGILRAADSFPEILVMEYLDGPETSVDILARSGEIIALMARRKPVIGQVRISGSSRTEWVDEGPHQILDRQPEVEEMARQLVAHFRLGGLLNIQFRSPAERPERPCLLEINGRMSGGLSYVGLTGLNLPLLAVKIALLEPGMPLPWIPEPRLPLRVGTRTEAFVVSDLP
jgi:hypothetical protein